MVYCISNVDMSYAQKQANNIPIVFFRFIEVSTKKGRETKYANIFRSFFG